jgi:hypothetical protein
VPPWLKQQEQSQGRVTLAWPGEPGICKTPLAFPGLGYGTLRLLKK